jgi:methionyl-tRNA formyltransferase
VRSNLKFIYAGNRSTVLRGMLFDDLQIVHVFPVVGSRLHHEVEELDIPFTPVSNKWEVLKGIRASNFDIFVSTGLPFILPISLLKTEMPGAKFINVHPSFLPDLRGADPIPGAILYRRDSGVTCHLMDDGIDTGQILHQALIPYFDGMDAKLLYNLAFKLEPLVFKVALAKDFLPMSPQAFSSDLVYYSFKSNELAIDFSKSNDYIVSCIRAFNTPNKGASFFIQDRPHLVFASSVIDTPEIVSRFNSSVSNQIVSIFEDSILVSRQDSLLWLKEIIPRPCQTGLGTILT